MKKEKSFWPLVLIMLIAVFFRFWDIQKMPPGLYPDEAMNGNNALEALHTGDFKMFYPENNGREGLFINIQAILVSIFGNNPWALRLVSGIFGVLTVLGIYFLARELFKDNKLQITNYKLQTNSKPQIQNSKKSDFSFGYLNFRNWSLFGNCHPAGDDPKGQKLEIGVSRCEKIALISSYFLATSFWHINFSRIGFRAIMAPAFLVWGLFLLLLFFRKIKLVEQLELLKSQIPNSNFQTNSKLQIQNSKQSNSIFGNWNLFGNCRPAGDDPKGQKLGIGNLLLLILSGVVYGLGFHSYIAYRATPLLPFLVFLFYFLAMKGMRKKVFSSAVIFFVSAFIAISPLLYYFYNNPQDFFGRTAQVSVFASENPARDLGENILKTLGMFWYKGDYNFRHNFAGEPQLWFPVGILFALGILICVFRILKFFRNWKLLVRRSLSEGGEIRNFKSNILPEFLLLTWFAVGLLPVVLSSEGLPHALRAIVVIPSVIIISAVGLEFLIQKIGSWLSRAEEKYSDIAGKIARIKKELRIVVYLFLISAGIYSYFLYFMKYAVRPEVYDAFAGNYVKIGEYLNTLPNETLKYIIVNANGADVRGYPMPTQTVMYISKTFLPEWREQKNIKYLLPEKLNEISCTAACAIITLENDPLLRQKLKQQIPDLISEPADGFIVLRK